MLAGIEDVELVGVTDRDASRAQQFASTFDTTAFGDLDGVEIATDGLVVGVGWWPGSAARAARGHGTFRGSGRPGGVCRVETAEEDGRR
ncbi:hypothetical protein GCM10023175_32320 [Pseudonocardia xishanensis]|uniref:Uncharacterized protein n=1 Tax=Pseudonocardia xishanensis TaxID=630995 RepID=A0ABP8RTE4_9PSEU